jgi:hypothetical protein
LRGRDLDSTGRSRDLEAKGPASGIKRERDDRPAAGARKVDAGGAKVEGARSVSDLSRSAGEEGHSSPAPASRKADNLARQLPGKVADAPPRKVADLSKVDKPGLQSEKAPKIEMAKSVVDELWAAVKCEECHSHQDARNMVSPHAAPVERNSPGGGPLRLRVTCRV